MSSRWELTLADVEKIQQEVGIERLGVTTAEPFEEIRVPLANYHEQGYESGFEHPILEERIDPKLTCSGAQSIVAIALSYRRPSHESTKRPQGIRGALSKYAWGSDYHTVLRDKLQQLAEAIERRVDRPIHYQLSVDTGPLVDRAVAQRAGIGWFGKNCSIITEGHGSWVFLGQLVTDVSIEPSPPGPHSLCGECDLCMRACPTGALVAPFVTDSSRCLSYITQMKGFVPEEYRSKFGTRIWGCDTCQVVCPSNKEATYSNHEAFDPDVDLAYPDLIALLDLSNRQFKRLFGYTAAAWRGYTIVKRNAIIALGNIRDARAVPKLIEQLRDERPEIRGTAVWALLQIRTPEAIAALHQLQGAEQNPQVLHELRTLNESCDAV